jgi:hypothetical protein
MRQKIWARYGGQLQELLAEEQSCPDLDNTDTGSWTIDF